MSPDREQNNQPTVSGNPEEGRPCPSCAELILPEARKCKYCGEFVDPNARKPKLSKRIVAVIGLFTAALSVFYTLREGYFYIEHKQQQRAEIVSYKKVATHFENMDSLEYAQQALTKALSLSPNNVDLQRRLFHLRAQAVLRDIELGNIEQDQMLRPLVEELILDGFRILESEKNAVRRARLMFMVARLLPQDMNWKDEDSITALFEKAYQVLPENAEVAFRFGQWLVDADLDKLRGLEMYSRAVDLEPKDALYHYELARLLRANGEYGQAMALLVKAIDLLPDQRELLRIRSSNASRTDLRSLLFKADKASDISQGEFYGLDMNARRKLLEQVLAERSNDRNLNFMAARFYFANGELALAEEAISKAVTEGDLARTFRGYNLEQFELYQDILQRSGTSPEKLQTINQALYDYQQSLTYDEALELGIEGGHRYKIGLRVNKQKPDEEKPGLEVLEAYSGYPFAKASVQAGDHILALAHRQPETVMSIYNILSNFKPGTSVPLLIEREGQEIEIELVVE